MLGDFALNSAWDDFDADPTLVDLFRWHAAEEVEHRNVAHDVATYFNDSYLDRVGAMLMASTFMFVMFQRVAWYLVKTDPDGGLRVVEDAATPLPRFQAPPSPPVPKAVRHQYP